MIFCRRARRVALPERHRHRPTKAPTSRRPFIPNCTRRRFPHSCILSSSCCQGILRAGIHAAYRPSPPLSSPPNPVWGGTIAICSREETYETTTRLQIDASTLSPCILFKTSLYDSMRYESYSWLKCIESSRNRCCWVRHLLLSASGVNATQPYSNLSRFRPSAFVF